MNQVNDNNQSEYDYLLLSNLYSFELDVNGKIVIMSNGSHLATA